MFLIGVFPLVFAVTGVIMLVAGQTEPSGRRFGPRRRSSSYNRQNGGPRAGVKETHAEVPSAASLPRMAMRGW